MPKIITFTAPKSGNGATFCCAGVWQELSQENCTVLALDVCFEKRSLDCALGFDNDYVYTLSDVAGGFCTLEEALCTSGNGSYIPADYESADFDVSAACEIIGNSSFEYVLVDISDRNEDVFEKVLQYTDILIYVTGPDYVSVKQCASLAERVDFAGSLVLVNKVIPAYIEKKIHHTIDEILDEVCSPLIGILPWTPEADIILRRGVQSPWGDELLKNAFSNIAGRIMGNHKPACEFRKTYDCFKLGRNFSLNKD